VTIVNLPVLILLPPIEGWKILLVRCLPQNVINWHSLIRVDTILFIFADLFVFVSLLKMSEKLCLSDQNILGNIAYFSCFCSGTPDCIFLVFLLRYPRWTDVARCLPATRLQVNFPAVARTGYIYSSAIIVHGRNRHINGRFVIRRNNSSQLSRTGNAEKFLTRSSDVDTDIRFSKNSKLYSKLFFAINFGDIFITSNTTCSVHLD
jgi:hypothetical protein